MFSRRSRLARLAPFVAVVASLSFIVAACGSAAPALSDPKDILSKGVSNLSSLKTLHMDATVAGSVKIDMSGGSAAGGTPFALDGTTLTGDVDVAGKKLQMSLTAPLLGKVEMVEADNAVYYKAAIMGSDKWTKQAMTGTAAATASDPQKAIDQIKTFLDKPAVAPIKQADEKVGDVDCYKISFKIPASELQGAAGAAASQLPSGMTLSDIPVVVWVSKADVRLTKVTFDVGLGTMGSVSIALTLSKFDVPVTITAPAADQVQAGG